MNPSFKPLQATRSHLIGQLVYFDEQYHHFMDTYLSGVSPSERIHLERVIKLYTDILPKMLANEDSVLDEMLKKVVLIGSKVSLRFEADGSLESFTVVYPTESDPDLNRISFISPIGRQLLCAEPHCPLVLETPNGSHPVQIHEISYAYIGGFQGG